MDLTITLHLHECAAPMTEALAHVLAAHEVVLEALPYEASVTEAHIGGCECQFSPEEVPAPAEEEEEEGRG